jgi:hypothetical protein
MEIKDIKTTIQSADITKLRIREKLLELYPNTISKIDLQIKEAIENGQVTIELKSDNKNEVTLMEILLDQGEYYYHTYIEGVNKGFIVTIKLYTALNERVW